MLDAPPRRADERVPLPHVAPQDANRILRAEGAGKQPKGVQLLDPLAIQDIALPSRHVLQPAGLDQPHLKASLFQQLEQGDPIDPRGLHRHRRYAALPEPVRQRLQVRSKGAEGPHRLRIASFRDADEMHRGADVNARRVDVDLLQFGRHRGCSHGQTAGHLRLLRPLGGTSGGLLGLGRSALLGLLDFALLPVFLGFQRRGLAVIGRKGHTGISWAGKTTAVGAGVMRLITLPNGVAPRCQAACHQRQHQELPGPSYRTGTRHQGQNGRLDPPPCTSLQ